MDNKDKVNVVVFLIIITVAAYALYTMTQPDYVRNLVDFDEKYNDARNQTIHEIEPNTTILQKMAIISFNCEKINLGSGWVNQCKDDLSRELI